jgi:hypothetical protein
MHEDKKIDEFLSQYDDEVFVNATHLRKVLFENLPDIIEQLDTSAKLIAYCYGQKYIELICVLIYGLCHYYRCSFISLCLVL